MNVDVSLLAMAFVWGTLLGLFYFGGLWLTISAILGKRWPRRWLAVSLLVRLAAALAGFWIVARTDPGAFFFTLGGFFLARAVLFRTIGRGSGGRQHAAHS